MRATTLCLVGVAALGSSRGLLPQQGDLLREANRAASVLVLERLRAQDPGAWRRIRRCPPRAILLVVGQHDHTNQVLDPLALRYRRVSPASFARQSLRDVELLIIDCPGMIGRAAALKAGRFVARGGTLLTTDWAVLHVLQEQFGDRLRHNGVRTRDDVVRIDDVTPHRFTRGVFPPGRPPAWWLENQSYPVDRLSDDLVVLFRSRELGERYGSSIVACTFSHGRGCVVHVVSHMYLQRTVHTRPWERRSALDEARELGLPVGSDGFKKLARSGALGRIRAGDLNATLSVQQFLLNIVVYALERRPLIPRMPRPGILTHEATVDTHLSRSPRGENSLKVSQGLRLELVRRAKDWVLVRTPAGQEGWIPAEDLAPRH